MTPRQNIVTYEFGCFRLNAQNRTLFWNGEAVVVGGRAIDLLIALAQHQGQILTKFQLMEAGWGKSCVHESNLKVTIGSLRRTLRQHEPTKDFIKTVVGRGYWLDTEHTKLDFDPISAEPQIGFVPIPETATIFGRGRTIAELRQTLAFKRFTTVVGPGGVGKTTVAIAAAQQYKDEVGISTTYIDLASVGGEDFVATKFATALGITHGGGNPLEAITVILSRRRTLLLIDTCEHVRDEVAHICNVILASTADVRIVATSRQVLGARGEHVFWLSPLETPSVGLNTRDAILRYPSAQLLAARAFEHSSYTIQDEDALSIGSICRSLDGVPLAIELVSSRLASHSAQAVCRELGDRLRILRKGGIGNALRHQTLLVTLEWSYTLLTDIEAHVLRAMSIFAGPFATDELVRVVNYMTFDGNQVFDAINGLRSKSMVSIDHTPGELRYRLLDTTRIFARDLLKSHGEYSTVALQHAHLQLETQRRGRLEHSNIPKQQWYASYAAKADDFRAAVDWALHQSGDVKLGIQLVAAGLTLWQELSLGSEARKNCTYALSQLERIQSTDLRLKLNLIVGNATSNAYDTESPEAATAIFEEAVRLAQEIGDTAAECRALGSLMIFKMLPADQAGLDALNPEFTRLHNAAIRSDDEHTIREEKLLRSIWDIFRGNLTDAYAELQHLKSELAQSPVGAASRFHINQKLNVDVQIGGVSWLIGKPGEALVLTEYAARQLLEHHHGLTLINGLARGVIWLFLQCHDYANAKVYTDILQENVYNHGITGWVPVANLYSAAIDVGTRANCSERKLVAALEAVQKGPPQLGNLSYLVTAVTSMVQLGAFETAARALDVILCQSPRPVLLPELLRLRAATERALVNDTVAQATLVESLQIATRVRSQAWRLRSAIDLAILLQHRGQAEQALLTLQPIFAQFSDGFSTGDLVIARHLLAELR
jgi:predicted ATPase/DNA-binding winged helix-turn-helix (wHTH) protein